MKMYTNWFCIDRTLHELAEYSMFKDLGIR